MSVWESKLRKYSRVASASLQNSLAYTANFFLDSFFFVFVVLIFSQMWRMIYQQGQTLADYTLSQMIWYFIVTELIAMTRSNVFEDLNEDIKNGNIAYLLNKPFHYVLYQAANGIGQIVSRLSIKLALGLILGFWLAGPLVHFPVQYFPWMLVAFGNGLVLNFLAIACLGLTAFWLEENTAFYWIYQKLTFILGTFLPIEVLPVWAQKIALFLPLSYINYGPAKLVVEYSAGRAFQIITVQFVYIAVLIGTVWLIYRKGVRRINVNGG